MSTKRGFIAGLCVGVIGGFSGANILMKDDGTGQGNQPAESDNTSSNETKEPAESNNTSSNETDESPFDANSVASEIRDLINQKRESVYGGIVSDLSYKDGLYQCAVYHAESMAESGSVSHEGPDGGLRARYNKFGLGVDIPNETIEKKINSNWENIGSVDSTGKEPAEIASGLVDTFDDEVMLYRPWSLNGVGVARSGSTVYCAINYL